MKITKIHAREILDSRGNPTVEVEMSDDINTVRACVPSGASTGVHEALELRDGDKSRYGGKGVLKAVHNVNKVIAPEIQGMDPNDQRGIDEKMLRIDGTGNKSVLGANAILGVSMAACRLAAAQNVEPLYKHIQNLYGAKEISIPRPMMNIINGGVHADSGLAMQEFMVFPKFDYFAKNLRAGAEIFHALAKILKEKGLATSVGDEGGFAPQIPKVREALEVIVQAIEAAGYKPGEQIEIAMDPAASEFLKDGKYLVDGEEYSTESLTDLYGELLADFPITSIEDSHGEDDIDGFKLMTERFPKLQVMGDDLFVTNKRRLEKGIRDNYCNSILIKVNQIGTLTETFETMQMAQENGYTTVVSHRSGETEDSFIADLAVGTNAGQIKTGSLSRSERICKYNQLTRIAEEIEERY